MIERECPCCGERTRADAPDGLTAPVQYGPRAAALGAYLWHGQFLPGPGLRRAGRDVRLRPVPGRAGRAGPQDRRGHLPGDHRHHHGPGRGGSGALRRDRVPGRREARLGPLTSAGKSVLVTVCPKRGQEGPDAAAVLPAFTGIACHDAWQPYDSYDGVAGHALCGAHLLRELIAVTETGTEDDVIWAQQAIGARLELKEAAGAARDAGRGTIDPEILEKQSRRFREAADAGIVLNAARHSKLQKKRNALATRMRDRADDYLRFARAGPV